MKTKAVLKQLAAAGAVIGGAFVSATAAFAQGCALCYADAAATGPQTQAALRHGILVLMIPPMILFAGFYFLLYRRSHVRRDALKEQPVMAHASRGSASEIILDLD